MSITKSFLRTLKPGSAEYVVAHAKFQKKRGRNFAATFHGVRNPRKALAVAHLALASKQTSDVDTVSIVGLNKADVLAVLYNAARPQDMGFMHYDPTPMTREIAEELLKQTTSFDYLIGRVMKISIDGDDISVQWYEMDNGHGIVERVIDSLRETGSVNTSLIKSIHGRGLLEAFAEIAN